MTSFSLLLLGHILATLILVGGAFMLQLLAVVVSRSGTQHELATLARQAAWIGPRVFMPCGVVIAATGAAMAARLGFGLGRPALLVGLAAIAVAAVTGPAYLAPESRRISDLIAVEGDASIEARSRLRRLFVVSRVELGVLVVAVVVMVLQPSL